MGGGEEERIIQHKWLGERVIFMMDVSEAAKRLAYSFISRKSQLVNLVLRPKIIQPRFIESFIE